MYVGNSNQLGGCDGCGARAQLGQLGFIETAFNIIALKNILGIGAKKKKFKQLEAEGKGKWTAQFPEWISWDEYLNKFDGAVRKVYEKERARKDSMLLKAQIASPEDFAAWHFATYGIKSGAEGLAPHCDPKATGGASYLWCPVDAESGINIYDEKKLRAHYEAIAAADNAAKAAADAAALKAAQATRAAQTATTPNIVYTQAPAQPQSQSQLIPGFDPTLFFAPQTQAPAPAPQSTLEKYAVPALAGVGIFAAVMLLGKPAKKTRKRRR